MMLHLAVSHRARPFRITQTVTAILIRSTLARRETLYLVSLHSFPLSSRVTAYHVSIMSESCC